MKRHLASFTALLAGLVLSFSCGRSEVDKALDRLDATIDRKEVFNLKFAHVLDSLRLNFQEVDSDSLKWECSNDLFWAFYHHSSDSSAHYLDQMWKYASDSRQGFETEMAAVRVDFLRGNTKEAVHRFRSIDPDLAEPSLFRSWLSGARALYSHLCKISGKGRLHDACQDTLLHYIGMTLEQDSVSFSGRRVKAQQMRLEGHLAEAIEFYIILYNDIECKMHSKASIAYNIASIYDDIGDRNEYILWLIRAAEADFMASNRDYLALYELAMLLEDHQIHRAERYIRINLTDVLEGNFKLRIPDSGKAQMGISEAVGLESRKKISGLALGLCFLSVMCVTIFFLLWYSARQRRRLKESKSLLISVNRELKFANERLNDANRIKDSYVFRYMELSINYLERFDKYRRDLRDLGKSGGLEAVMKSLRSPSLMYNEYDMYYRIFDETFLGLYPDFVAKVNRLLREDARFPEPSRGKSLSTELRILAAIRIGITQSGKIATFLKCSPATVYTYRTRMRNAAICSKDEFEASITRI